MSRVKRLSGSLVSSVNGRESNDDFKFVTFSMRHTECLSKLRNMILDRKYEA